MKKTVLVQAEGCVDGTKLCRRKEWATPKAPQNMMNNNQKRRFKRGKYSWPMAFHERPEWAKIF